MFNPKYLLEEYRKFGETQAGMEKVKEAIVKADEANDPYWRAYFRYEYVRMSVWVEDNFKALITFPELLKIYDDNLEIQPKLQDDVMTAYKWFLQDSEDYYQVSKAEVDKFYDDYEKRCQEYGFSKRVYYMKRATFNINCDLEKVKEYYKEFVKYKRDINSDCEACELSQQAHFELVLGDYEKAYKLAEPIFSRKKLCGEIPHVTYSLFSEYHLSQGDYDKAWYYANLGAKEIGISANFLRLAGRFIKTFSVTDLDAGIRLFTKYMNYFNSANNPAMKLEFAIGAYNLFKAVSENTENQTLSLPIKIDIKSEDSEYQIKDLIKYFYNYSIDIATNFDQRNESSFFTDKLNKEYPCVAKDFQVHQKGRKTHAMCSKSNSVLAGFLKSEECPSLDEILEYIMSSDDIQIVDHIKTIDSIRGSETLNITVNIDDVSYAVKFMYENIADFKSGFDMDYLYAIEGTTEEEKALLEQAERVLVCNMEFEKTANISFQKQIMILKRAVPKLQAAVDISRLKIYYNQYLEFVSKYINSVGLDNLIRLLIFKNEDDSFIMVTHGLSCLGFKELAIDGLDTQDFQKSDAILTSVAKYIVYTWKFPDARECIMEVELENSNMFFSWIDITNDKDEGKSNLAFLAFYASEADMNNNKIQLASKLETEALDYLRSYLVYWFEFDRQKFLARETFDIFKAKYDKTPKAVIKYYYPLPDEIAKKVRYSCDIMWVKVNKIENDIIYGVVDTASRCDPKMTVGTKVEFDIKRVIGWAIAQQGNFIYEEQAYLLM